MNEKNAEKSRKLVNEYVPEIEKTIYSVDQMLSDVMNMGAQTNLHKEHVNLRDLLESVCREVLSIYQRSDVTILFDIDSYQGTIC